MEDTSSEPIIVRRVVSPSEMTKQSVVFMHVNSAPCVEAEIRRGSGRIQFYMENRCAAGLSSVQLEHRIARLSR